MKEHLNVIKEKKKAKEKGKKLAPTGTQTRDLLLKSCAFYQLSYGG
jgi:hypothetical protein